MATNLGLITYAAKRNAHEGPVKGVGDGARHRTLPHSRWPHETKRRVGLVLAEQLAHRQEFQHPFLDLLEAVMAAVQVPGHGGQLIIRLLGKLAPGQDKNIIQIITDDGDLRRERRGRLELADLLAHRLRRRRIQFFLIEQFQILLDGFILGLGGVLQFLADDLQLLVQEYLSLSRLDLVLHLLVQVALHVKDGILLDQNPQHFIQPLLTVAGLQQLLLLLEGDHHVGGHGIAQLVGIGDGAHQLADLIGHGRV